MQEHIISGSIKLLLWRQLTPPKKENEHFTEQPIVDATKTLFIAAVSKGNR